MTWYSLSTEIAAVFHEATLPPWLLHTTWEPTMQTDEEQAEAVIEGLATSEEWRRDSLHWRGEVLTGKYSHYCNDWDGLPMDETCMEWPCGCDTWAETPEAVARRRAFGFND